MRRRLFTMASVVSLALSAVVVTLWVHSGARYIYACAYTAAPSGWVQWEIGSARGRVYFKRVLPVMRSGGPDYETGGGPGAGPANWNWFPGHSLPGEVAFGGFNFYHAPGSPPRRDYREVVVPHYFLLVLGLLLPARGWAKRRRTAPGLCPDCGYDLRATPDRCPECGKVLITRPRPAGD